MNENKKIYLGKSHKSIKIALRLFCALLFFQFILPFDASAVSINSVSGRTDVHVGEKVDITIVVDTQGKNINAISSELNFDPKVLKPYAISISDSVIGMWVDNPIKYDSYIKWSGIMPGGFTGVRSAFYDGVHPGTLLKVSFLALKTAETNLSFGDSEAYLNDGKGLPMNISKKGILIKIVPGEALADFIPNLQTDSNISLYESRGSASSSLYSLLGDLIKNNNWNVVVLCIAILICLWLIFLYIRNKLR